MKETYQVNAPNKVADQLPGEVQVESGQLDSTLRDLNSRVGENYKLSANKESKTVEVLEFIRD